EKGELPLSLRISDACEGRRTPTWTTRDAGNDDRRLLPASRDGLRRCSCRYSVPEGAAPAPLPFEPGAGASAVFFPRRAGFIVPAAARSPGNSSRTVGSARKRNCAAARTSVYSRVSSVNTRGRSSLYWPERLAAARISARILLATE